MSALPVSVQRTLDEWHLEGRSGELRLRYLNGTVVEVVEEHSWAVERPKDKRLIT